ncbi:ankyrin repeat domain-containing protein [Pseudodesulfovibrio karagichevae]|uniref:Ankyrin repeat domain-containing protein n=1 Tax=Pseudodesulfovibrio karagichevae TaxID=3239305 RepID=A0ABV4K113_9BACT
MNLPACVRYLIPVCLLCLTLLPSTAQGKTLIELSRSLDARPVWEALADGADPHERDKNDNTPLHIAAAWGTPDICRALLRAGAEVDARNKYGVTPLIAAAGQGRAANMVVLMEAGADVNAASNYGGTPLHAAFMAHGPAALEALRVLLERKPDLDVRDKQGNTSLCLGIGRVESSCILLLLDAGADPNIPNKLGQTAVHEAVRANRVALMEHLIRHGAKLNTPGRYGTPLQTAARSNFPAMSELLTANGAKDSRLTSGPTPRPEKDKGEYPLHQAAQSKFGLEQVRSLLKEGADPNQADRFKKTPLAYAVQEGRLSTIILLLEAGADPNIPDSQWDYPLHSAAQNNRPEVIKYLLQYGAKPDQMGRLDTPLQRAASLDWYGAAKVLIKAGADLDMASGMGLTALAYAAAEPDSRVAPLLIESGADVNRQGRAKMSPLFICVAEHNIETVNLLLAHGADINATGPGGVSSLQVAVKKRYPDMVELLLKAGADGAQRDQFGRTAMHLAARTNEVATLKLLESKGYAVDEPDRLGMTPLFSAAMSGRKEAAEYLIQQGADIMTTDRGGDTPLHQAALNAQPETCALLIDAGADINAPDKRGQTPLDLALSRLGNKRQPRGETKQRLLDAVEYLKAHGARETAKKKPGPPV